MTQGVTHGVTHESSPARPGPRAQPAPRARRRPARSPGPYLQKRVGTFYFRKRLSRRLSEKCGSEFLCISLRTSFQREAMQRALRLLATLDEAEQTMLSEPAIEALKPEEIRVLITEALRLELGKIIDGQQAAAARSDEEIDSRIEALEEEIKRLRRASRRNDFDPAHEWLAPAARTTSVTPPSRLTTDVGREVLGVMRQLVEVAIAVEDGEDAVSRSAPLVAPYSSASVKDFVQKPVLISNATEESKKHYSATVQKTVQVTSSLLVTFATDCPVDLLTKEKQKEFFAFLSRLPKDHGRKHGKNRYNSEGTPLTKLEEIEAADQRDARIKDEIRAMDISQHEKRALLADRLTPRVTVANLHKHLGNLGRIFHGARELGAASGLDLITRKELAEHLATLRTGDPLDLRVTQGKERLAWTTERLEKFFTSPLFRGCFSKHRRSRPGKVIIRDASYWIPLIVVMMGTRIEEILQLRRTDLQKRNRMHVLSIGTHGNAEQTTKNEDSRRFIPIPDSLLKLGFVDWVHTLPAEHGPLLFPEAAARSGSGKLSDAFGKHFRRLLENLGVGDSEEDFYALRKTLLSALDQANVPDAVRKAIAGHKQQDIINRHYTAQNAPKLRTALDLADYGLEIQHSERHGYPIIVGCSVGRERVFEASVELGDQGEAKQVRVIDCADGKEVFAAHISFDSTYAGGKHEGLRIMSPFDAAKRLSEYDAEGYLRRPKYGPKLAALESLEAYA
ncbi:integrase [Defluviimonas sp. 20V17]|nr:integrase [Defluviimonas sp. 20V17]